MAARSAGLLIYRHEADELQILLVHPGGPFWAKKDAAAWSIPKGLIEAGEDELAAAIRETEEELGVTVRGVFSRLGEFRQPGGKTIVVWCGRAEPSLNIDAIRSNDFEMEWPPKSGHRRQFPEVDKAGWFTLAEARVKMHRGQQPMLAAFLDLPSEDRDA